MTILASRPARSTELYRGYTLVHERMGHTNVETVKGFYGGYPTPTAARARVDELIRRASTTVERVNLPGGRVGYRVST